MGRDRAPGLLLAQAHPDRALDKVMELRSVLVLLVRRHLAPKSALIQRGRLRHTEVALRELVLVLAS